MTRSAATMMIAVALMLPQVAAAQDHPVGGLRISDETGQALGQQPSPPGEKHFHLDSGIDGFDIAFECQGAETTEVEIKVLGPMGTILFHETGSYEGPGTFVVGFDNGAALEDNEYVVNAYVGEEKYLADSLQLAVGAARIAPSNVDDAQVVAESAAEPDSQVLEPVGVSTGSAQQASAGKVPGGPSQWTLLLAGLGIVVLLAVVVWAARSAARA